MKTYKDIFFVIDKNNFLTDRTNLFYGYKTVENEGFWIDIKHRLDGKINIYTSYISPVIIIFEQADYWAISNSCYYLVKYLNSIGINLNKNSKFTELEQKSNTAFSYYYVPDVLMYENLKIIDNKYDLVITAAGELTLKEKALKLFTKDINLNLNLLYEWYNKYAEFCDPLKNLTIRMSGGLDSRLLWYLFIRDNKHAKVSCSYNKPNVSDGLDYELASQVLAYYKVTADEVSTRKVEILDVDSVEITEDNLSLKEFAMGTMYNLPIIRAKCEPELNYRLMGTASNIYRYEFQDLTFLNGNIRRNWVSLFIARYYMLKQAYVLPYLDSCLLQLNTLESDYLHVALYSIFAKSLLTNGIPFTTKTAVGKYFFQDFRKDLFDNFLNNTLIH